MFNFKTKQWKRFYSFYYSKPGAIKNIRFPDRTFEVHLITQQTMETGLFDVFAGFAVSKLEDIPLKCMARQLPFTEYAIFRLKGQEIASDWNEEILRKLPQEEYEVSYDYSILCYDSRFKGMDDIRNIYKAICFIEDNLKEQVTVMEAAKAAGYSIFHFSRAFNEFTGHNPYDYLIRRRLSEAAKTIIQNDKSLTDIAFLYRFNNLETFSRAFRKMFGMTPSRYKTEHFRCKVSLKLPSSMEYLTHINSNSYFFPCPVETKQLLLIGEVPGLSPGAVRLQHPGRRLVLAFEPYKSAGSIVRIPFTEVNTLETMPEYAVGKSIPPLSCIEFHHSSGPIQSTYEYIFQTWLPLFGYSICLPYSIEFGYGASEVNILIPVALGTKL